MESYGNDMFLSQEGYASIDFTLLDRPSTSVAAVPESTAALLPDSSFPSFDFLDNSGVESFGGALHTAGESQFGSQGRSEMDKEMDWRKENTHHPSSTNMYIQGVGNQEPRLSSPQFHMPVSQVDFFSAKQSCSDNVQAQLSSSGNRVGDEVHDFFEQEHLSQQQSQLERRENWSVLNSNSLSADKRTKESHYVHSTYDTDSSNLETVSGKANRARDSTAFDRPRNIDMVSTGMLSFMPIEVQPGDGRHASRMALGARSPQGGPNNSVMEIQPRNQPLNFDSLLTGSPAGHIRANQATSAGDSGTPERSQSNAGSLDGTDTQQGHNVGQGSSHGRNNTEGGENIEARVNYDFLGSQIHLKGQPQAGVQYHGARLQPGLDEIQAWKQQYSYQFRRQQQAQQLEQEAQQQQARQRFQLEQQARQQQAQQIEQQMRHQQVQQLMPHDRQQQSQQFLPHGRQQQSQQLMLHARQQQSQQIEQQTRQQQAQQLEQQTRVQQAQQLEQQTRAQQAQQLELQARQQQAQQLELQARQLQAQQLEHQARQLQAQQLEQQARQQQVQQLEHQARQQQAQQLEHQARQQQAQQLEHQARQQRAQLLEQQIRQQRAQQIEQHSRQQQAQQLEQHTLQQQAQQLDQHTRQQQAHQLDQNARHLQAQQLEQHARWQKQLQQVLAGDNQNMGNQFAPSLYGSSMHDGSNFMRSTILMSQMGIESHTPALLPGNLHRFSVGNMNRMPNGSPSLHGFPPEVLLSQDPNLAMQALALMGAPMDPSVYGPAANMRDAAGQPLNSYPSSQVSVQQLADAPHKLASPANHQVGKPVAHTLGMVASVPGDHRTISSDLTTAKIDGKQGTLITSSFGHSFPQNHGVNNLQQGTTMSRYPQLQDFNLKQQQRSWNEDLGQKDNFQGVSSQVLGDSDTPSESGFNNFQQGGWPSMPAAQVVASSDGRNQSTSAGQYVLQGAYPTENTDFLSSLAVNPQGSWSALMQSAVAESPSGDGEHDDWSGMNLQKTETTSGDSPHFHPNVKEQNIWSEQNAQLHNSMNGRSFSLFNDESVHSVQALPQSSSEGRGLLGSKLEGIQHGNQIKLQSGPSSKLIPEPAGQAGRWQDQNLYQHIDKSSSPHSYSSFENKQGNSWMTHNMEQVPSEGRLPSRHINFDGSQQNNSLQNQSSFKTESHRMISLTSKDQSGWNKNEAQESEQNKIYPNSNKGYREKENDIIEREQMDNCRDKGEGQIYQIRYEGNKDTSASFQIQDPKLNVYQNGQPLQQDDFSTVVFSKNVNEDNLENSAGRQRQIPESKYQLDSSNNAILDTYAKNRVIGNASIYRQSNSSQAWNLFPNSFSSPQRETNDKSQSQYSQNDSITAGQIAGKGDANPQTANNGTDYARDSPQKENDLQSLSNVNHRGYSRLSKMSVGLEENSGNNMLRMMPGHMSQQMVGNVLTNYRPAEGAMQDLSLRRASYLDSLGQKTPELTEFRQPNVARALSLNSTMPVGEDILSTELQNDLREKAGGGYFKDISLGHTSTSSAFDRSTNIGSSNKQTSLRSQNMLDLLTKPDHSKEGDASKGTVFGEHNASVELCESSSDASLGHFGRNQLSGPPQNFGLRLATTPQLLQMLHGRSLQSSAPSQTANVLNDRQSHPSKEDSVQRSVDSATHPGSSSKVTEASIADGQSLHLTASAKPLNVPHELSPAVSKEIVVDLKEKASCIADPNIHPSKMQYIQRTNVIGQLPSSPQSMVSHSVPESQSHVQGSMMCTNQLQGSEDDVIAGQLALTCNAITQSKVSSVNAIIDEESDMQGSFPPSTRSFGQSSYPTDLLAQDGQNHKIVSLPGSLSGLRNSDQGLHESWSKSASQLPGTSGRSQSAAFLKLLNAFKTSCANQQRLPIGAEKVFPNVFESFRPPIGGSGQSFLPRSDSQMKFGMVGKPTASMRNQTYRPYIINSQQLASTEDLSKQEKLFQQMASDRGESSGIPVPQNSMMALPVAVPTLPLQTSALNSQLSMLQSQGQDPRKFSVSNILLNTPSIVSSLTSGLYTNNRDRMECTDGQDSQAIQHSTCPPTQQQSDSCSDGPVDSQASDLSDAPRRQYISSNQVVSRTAMQNDFDKKAAKRLKITDAGSSAIGPNVSAKSGDQIINLHTGLEPFNVASTTRSAHELGALSVDTRILPSSQVIKERNEAASSQGITTMMQRQLQNQGYNHIVYQSLQSSSGADDRNHVNLQYPNSRSLQFGNDTNQKLFALRMAEMYKRMGESGMPATLTSKQMIPGRNVESLFPSAGLATPITSYTSESALKEFDSIGPTQNPAAQSLPPAKENAMHQHQYYLSKSNIGPPVTVLPKKRKKLASTLIPWHVEIGQTGGELPSTRDTEMAWAAATNRLTEKEEGEIENHEEGIKSVARVKRRLKLTTQLMQQLVPPLPAAVVRGKASIEHENATYILAKTALGDACKLVSTWTTDPGEDVENENLALRQLQKHTKFKGKSTLQIAEAFMDRAKNLDDDFLRLEASLSITELRNETQDLDRLSITNRLVKHHGRSLPVEPAKTITEERDSSSDSSICTRKLYPQRYVTAVPMPRNLPEGVLCLSL